MTLQLFEICLAIYEIIEAEKERVEMCVRASERLRARAPCTHKAKFCPTSDINLMREKFPDTVHGEATSYASVHLSFYEPEGRRFETR
jgi:hypothetical protein